MKKTLIGLSVLLTAGSLFAQVNYYRAKQQAVRDSRMNDANQQRTLGEANGVAPASAPVPAPAAPAAPMDPALQATIANINSLQGEFAALAKSAGDQPDTAQRNSLRTNLSAAAQGDKKASEDSVKKLTDDLLKAVAGKKKLAVPQQLKLAQFVHALFNSSHLSVAQQQTLLTNVQKILTDGGVSLDDTVNVVTDLKTVVAETK